MASVTFSHYHDKYAPGDKAEVDDAVAANLVNGGVALYSTKPEAKRAGADPESAASVRDK